MMNGDSSWCSITSGGRVSDRLNPSVSLHVSVCKWFIRFSPGDVILHSYLHVLLLADMCLLKKQQSCWRRSIVRWNGSAVTLETTGWVSTDVFLRNYHETSERGDNVGLSVTTTVLVDVTMMVEGWRVSHRGLSLSWYETLYRLPSMISWYIRRFIWFYQLQYSNLHPVTGVAVSISKSSRLVCRSDNKMLLRWFKNIELRIVYLDVAGRVELSFICPVTT